MKIGFTSTTFKKLEAEEICALAARAGADCIEWSGLHVSNPARAGEIAARCIATGIERCSLGSYYYVGEAGAERWESLCQTAAALGAGLIRVWLGKKGGAQTDEDEYAAILADAENMLKTASGCGLAIAAEAHPNTYNDSLETSLRFLRDIDNKGFGTYFQSLYLDMDADLERLERTFLYIRAVHVSFSEVKKNRRLRPKEDCVEAIINKLREKNFQGPVLLEFCKNDRPDEFLKDMDYLRRLTDA